MPELTFASFDEIKNELNRRYPAFVLSVLYHPEGSAPGAAPCTRIEFGGPQGPVTCLGLADAALVAVRGVVLGPLRVIDSATPLDPPR